MILGFVCCSNPSGSTNNNTLDNCDICDGVQDESHEHDYCLECDGVQGSDHEHQVVTPEPEPDVDYCDICDGVQDASHEHDYCLECDGEVATMNTKKLLPRPNQRMTNISTLPPLVAKTVLTKLPTPMYQNLILKTGIKPLKNNLIYVRLILKPMLKI